MRSRLPADPEAGRLIAAAARPVLEPLGCRQRGHSRVWIADRRFWLIVVDFRASRSGAETSLDVGAHWLWYAQGRWCFDYGRHVAAPAAYRDAAQFAPVAAALAARAGEEVKAIGRNFASVSDIARHLLANPDEAFWPLYHKAVVSGLAGDTGAAEQHFRRLADKQASRAWEAQLQSAAGALARHLPDGAAFRQAVAKVIARTRALQGLPPDPAYLD
jgi:hypothetical protein